MHQEMFTTLNRTKYLIIRRKITQRGGTDIQDSVLSFHHCSKSDHNDQRKMCSSGKQHCLRQALMGTAALLAQGWQNNNNPNGKKYIELNYVRPKYSQLCHSQHCKINTTIIKEGTNKKDRWGRHFSILEAMQRCETRSQSQWLLKMINLLCIVCTVHFGTVDCVYCVYCV